VLRRIDAAEEPRRSPLESTSSLDALYRLLLLRITLFGVTSLHLIHTAVPLRTEDSSTAEESSVHASTVRPTGRDQQLATTAVARQSTPGADLHRSDLGRREVHQLRAHRPGVSIVRSAHRGRHHQRICQRVERQRSGCR
jgi:hypothetical protein